MNFYNQVVDKKGLKKLLSWFIENYGAPRTAQVIEAFKFLGFHYATKAGLSIGFDDLSIPQTKGTLLESSLKLADKVEQKFLRGSITALERYQKLIDIWTTTSETLKEEVIQNFQKTPLNPLYMMAFSGARGNISQVRQLVGMRGLMSDSGGGIIDFPIRRNFREGLTVTEYVISCYGARKGLIDTALRTADSGYLTRRLVDVAHGILITRIDCGSSEGVYLSLTNRNFSSTAEGRVLAENIIVELENPERSRLPSKLHIAWRNQELSSPVIRELLTFLGKKEKIRRIPEIDTIKVRSPLTCWATATIEKESFAISGQKPEIGQSAKRTTQRSYATQTSLCQLCYGWNLAQGRLVAIGEAVGILAAQSIGEPGTQLTMRTFHTGGIFSTDVQDKVFAPHSGKIAWSSESRGLKVRNYHGETGFLCFEPLQLKLTEINDLDKMSQRSSILSLPAQSLIFVVPGSFIQKNTLCAELSRIVPHVLKRKKIQSFKRKKQSSSQFKKPTAEKRLNRDEGRDPSPGFNRLKAAGLRNGQLIDSQVKRFSKPEKQQKLDQQNTKKQSNWRLPIQSDILNRVEGSGRSPRLNRSLPSSPLKYSGVFNISTFGMNAHSIGYKNADLDPDSLTSKSISLKSELGNAQEKDFSLTVRNPKLKSLKKNTDKKSESDNLAARITKNVYSEIQGELYYGALHTVWVQEAYPAIRKQSLHAFTSGDLIYWKGKRQIKEKEFRLGSAYSLMNFSVNSNNSPIQKDESSVECLEIQKRLEDEFSSEFLVQPLKRYKECLDSPEKTIEENESLFQFPIQQVSYKLGDFFRTGDKIYKKDSKAFRLQLSGQIIRLRFFDSELRHKKLSQNKNLKLTSYLSVFQNFQKQLNCHLSEKELIPKEEKKVKRLFSLRRSQPHVFSGKGFGLEEILYSKQEKDEQKKRSIFSKTQNYLDHAVSVSDAEKLLQPLQADPLWGLRNSDILGVKSKNDGPHLQNELNQANLINKRLGRLVQKRELLFKLFQPEEQSKTGDIVQGLPKIEQLFEARNRKSEDEQEEETIDNNRSSVQKPISNDQVNIGDGKLSLAMPEQRKLVEEIQRVYNSQGVEIADKHIEIIVRLMTAKIQILDTPGSTSPFFPDDIIDAKHLEEDYSQSSDPDRKKSPLSLTFPPPPFYKPIILGITKVAFFTESFISAASFQETKRVLMNAALMNRVDFLYGLKENVILGRCIPAGTGKDFN